LEAAKADSEIETTDYVIILDRCLQLLGAMLAMTLVAGAPVFDTVYAAAAWAKRLTSESRFPPA
jgi:hypothetical protein